MRQVDSSKIQALSDDQLKAEIDKRAGKKSPVLAAMAAEWNSRHKRVFRPNPERAIAQVLLLVAEEKKSTVEKYLRRHIKD